MMIVVTALVCVTRVSADSVARSVPGGYCVILSSVQITDAGSDPNDYHIAPDGRLTIKTPGLWQVFYKASPLFSDPNPTYIDFVGIDVVPNNPSLGFSIPFWGKNLTGPCNFGGYGQIAIHLLQGGTIAGNGSIYAPEYDVRASPGYSIEVDGSLTRPITVRAINAGISVIVWGNVSGQGELRASTLIGAIRIVGSLSGRIWINGNLQAGGKIYIDGELYNGSFPDEVHIGGTMASTAAIAIDYGGYHANDNWQSEATVRINNVLYTSNPGNYPSNRIYRITSCRGDMNNDGVVDDDSDTAGFDADAATYTANCPGLGGSRYFHADCDQDGQVWVTGAPFSDDAAVFNGLKVSGCCVTTCSDIHDLCMGDIDMDGDVDIQDQAYLLSEFGSCEPSIQFPCSDFDGDGCIALQDLTILLSNFGNNCGCSALSGLLAGLVSTVREGDVTEIQVPTVDVNCACQEGVAVVTISFDVPQAGDVWTVSGLRALALNGAVFVHEAAAPASDCALFAPSEPSLIIGGFDPPSQGYVRSPQELNASWIGLSAQSVETSDLARVAIGVGEVEWPSAWGFPTAYFSESGPVGANDVAIASLRFVAATRDLGGKFIQKSGQVYLGAP
ncbi:MAG: hypothetical protein IT450_06725 [Phycisphaerales bacterium]|nr:hypothetical protein [Phycisphaerales bacterium]